MFNENNAHVGVYQILDGVLGGGGVPPGARGTMFSIIDHLRAISAPTENLRRAEQVAIEIHKLEAALRSSDEPAVQGARDELKALAAAWIQTRISSPLRH